MGPEFPAMLANMEANLKDGSCLVLRVFATTGTTGYNPGMIKTRVVFPVLGSLFLIGGIAIAQRPVDNVSKGRHPNLAAAQRLSTQAYEKITAAQEANEWDMQGHAKKAKQLLEEVNNELKQAAMAANKNK
jgi:hypothetical protein